MEPSREQALPPGNDLVTGRLRAGARVFFGGACLGFGVLLGHFALFTDRFLETWFAPLHTLWVVACTALLVWGVLVVVQDRASTRPVIRGVGVWAAGWLATMIVSWIAIGQVVSWYGSPQPGSGVSVAAALVGAVIVGVELALLLVATRLDTWIHGNNRRRNNRELVASEAAGRYTSEGHISHGNERGVERP